MSTIANLYADVKTLCQQWFYTKNEVDTALNDLVDTIYPVGSIYMSVNSTSPQTLFGGTWEQIKDKFLLASGTSYSNGATGGSADAIVVQHNHTLSGSYTYLLATSGSAISKSNNAGQTGTKVNNLLYQTDGSIARTEIANKGSSGTGKNMPPYLAVNVWKRTA